MASVCMCACHETYVATYVASTPHHLLIRFLPLQYLLAMVYVYFRRANLTLDQYTRVNFFAAL